MTWCEPCSATLDRAIPTPLTGRSRPLSHHLRMFRDRGDVAGEKRGRMLHDRLADGHGNTILAEWIGRPLLVSLMALAALGRAAVVAIHELGGVAVNANGLRARPRVTTGVALAAADAQS